MQVSRIARHLLMTPWQVRRAFPRRTLHAVETAIRASASAHAGEIRFAVEGALHGWALYRGQSPRERAIEVFSRLRMWDTDHRNGVLIYVLLADRAVEIVADRGAHALVGTQEWEGICRRMEGEFKAGRYESGVLHGIEAVTGHLARHFPATAKEQRALPVRPVVL
ncbi:MAG TPA: TPM domain-containing protein [Steroidobacteraceae bacterium]|nr:TPM domain-containing protein [Steroidobacteraceae bacterium]